MVSLVCTGSVSVSVVTTAMLYVRARVKHYSLFSATTRTRFHLSAPGVDAMRLITCHVVSV